VARTTAGARKIMTTTVNERSGWPGSVKDDQRPEPAGFLGSYPGYRSTAPLDRLRATEYSYQGAFGLTQADWRRAARGQARTLDQYLDLLGLPSGGALRASVGLASNVDDVERFIAFVELTYTDRVVGTAGLAPRQGC
jgi:hypothetical protein